VGKDRRQNRTERASERLALLSALPVIEAKTFIIADAAAAGDRWIIDAAR
jgi:hypothetical protein